MCYEVDCLKQPCIVQFSSALQGEKEDNKRRHLSFNTPLHMQPNEFMDCITMSNNQHLASADHALLK